MAFEVVTVSLAERSYQVQIGSGLITTAGEKFSAFLPAGRRVAIVTDSHVGPLYAAALEKSLITSGYQPIIITVPAGEASKSMSVVEDVCRQMMRAGCDRSCAVIALGGGVIGDLGGFVAAIYFRGVPYVQMPTTIVSLVDSSVGGKTGVNAPEGKNLIGAFHQPQLVLADISTLQTLPEREYHEGFAEVIKHAAIAEAEMLPLIQQVRHDRSHLSELIARNVAIKARIVSADEYETKGLRALLNFGHTIGHAIEATAGYGQMFHGEAISLGMRAALRLSRQFSTLTAEEEKTVLDLLAAYQLPLVLPSDYATPQIMEKLDRDKKFSSGQIRYVLLEKLGHAFVSDQVTRAAIEEAVEYIRRPL